LYLSKEEGGIKKSLTKDAMKMS